MKVNFVSPYGGFTGYSVFARGLVTALDALGVDVVGIADDTPDPKTLSPKLIEILNRAAEAVDLSVPCVRMSSAFPRIMAFAPGTPRIGYTMFEVDRVPAFWAGILNQMDRVWTPSNWGAKMLKSSGVNRPISVVPGGADTELYKPEAEPFGKEEKVRDDTFKFLYVGKWEKRKNTDFLIQAFADEFKPDEKVELWLQWFNPFVQFDPYERVFQLNLPRHANIVFLQQFAEPLMPRMYRTADAFVLPTRGEGWGLPAMEAMACGTCPIVPNTTSLADFVTPANAFIVKDLGLVDVDDKIFFSYVPDAKWHDPDIGHLRFLMRYAFENRDETKAKGEQAAKDIREKWTWRHAAEIAKKELEAL